ncbi:MAG: ATP-dependent Clp protease adaptor ClpS [Verrucomicrobiaceae bacterium]|nr:ATP-dependent Clp protease adaptor ClpS [Verrucomicrobiaceae bacterium]
MIRSATTTAPPPPKRAPVRPITQPGLPARQPRFEPPWHVILINDDEHSFEYVIDMMADIFGHSRELGKKIAEEVHEKGRVICATVHKELAELRQQQIHEYKPKDTDHGIGPMRCVIEPSV